MSIGVCGKLHGERCLREIGVEVPRQRRRQRGQRGPIQPAFRQCGIQGLDQARGTKGAAPMHVLPAETTRQPQGGQRGIGLPAGRRRVRRTALPIVGPPSPVT